MRGKWALKGEPALVDSGQSPAWGEGQLLPGGVPGDGREPAPAKAGVEWMEPESNSNSESPVAFLRRLKGKRPGPLRVIWDNAPAHRGEALTKRLTRPA